MKLATMAAARSAALGTVLLAGGCEATRDAGEQVQREAGVMAEKTRAGAADMVSAAGERTVEAGESAAKYAADWAGEVYRSGQLSETAHAWLRSGAAASQAGIEAVLQRGEQAVPAAREIGAALASAVDSDTMFEPIYQEVGQEVSGASPELALRRAEADAAIQNMTRVEVIDGLQVGFKELSSLDPGHHVREQAYLVVWRQGDHLVGFVYRSRRDIALGQLVSLAPRLVGLVRSAM